MSLYSTSYCDTSSQCSYTRPRKSVGKTQGESRELHPILLFEFVPALIQGTKHDCGNEPGLGCGILW
jgi:hypothetical protein